ncbi:unnamed protein product [Clavelina lepadiformis]|uniref:Uncharacterized protein n=1 Tax=Clavelina lepadiformis TaxID=159417 RepID=A0ABP0G9X9_CLALP
MDNRRGNEVNLIKVKSALCSFKNKLALYGRNLARRNSSSFPACNNLLSATKIDRLNLSGNKFGDAGVPFIMSCLDKIEKLHMTDCNITEEGVRPKVLEFSYDKMNRSKVLCCGLDQLEYANFSNLNMTPVGVEALAAAINKLPQPNMDYENVSRLYKDLQAAHTRAKACTIKKEGTSPFVEAKINGIYQELLDAYLSHGDIADGNLGRQECETTRREFTERLAAVPDVSDSAEPPSRRPNASTKHDKAANPKTAERGKGKDIQQEAERQFLEANQAAQDSLRQKQQELYVAQEIASTRDKATTSAASSVAAAFESNRVAIHNTAATTYEFRVHLYLLPILDCVT